MLKFRMRVIASTCLLLLQFAAFAKSDDVDLVMNDGEMWKLLRAMVNQTKADTLNLPANATSIRENIVDTFSCENRTYGYYADVDNDCQLFHVCLPSQTPSGRSVIYKWSFICPNETIFNQEVLVCSRPRDAVDCADAPMYYYVNMEFGKIPGNDTEDVQSENADNQNAINNPDSNTDTGMKETENVPNQIKRRNEHNRRKQNIIVQHLLKEVMNDQIRNENLKTAQYYERNVEPSEVNVEIPFPVKIEDVIDFKPQADEVRDENPVKDVENSRLISERSLKRKGRKVRRGSFRFRADV